MVHHANETSQATDDTPAKAVPLRGLRLAFLVYRLTSPVFARPKIRFFEPQRSGIPLLTSHAVFWYNVVGETHEDTTQVSLNVDA
jgi:hypothetical protein